MSNLPPVVAHEATEKGWRGLTADGEILDVRGINGAPAVVPREGVIVAGHNGGGFIGERTLPKDVRPGLIDEYIHHYDRARELMRASDLPAALIEIEAAMALAPTARARFNRGSVLLGLGRWIEGFDDWLECEASPIFTRHMTTMALAAGLRRWRGEDIKGKRLLLLHDPQDHGFGDTIMMLRYVPRLQAMGADVMLVVPDPLAPLAAQLAPVAQGAVEAHFFIPLLGLLRVLEQEPQTVPLEKYLAVDPSLADEWRERLGSRQRKRIGIAWSAGNWHKDDYPRIASLGVFVKHLPDVDLISVQQQGAAEADLYGVQNFAFDDFADCAALMSVLDEIVTVDTAAVHVAGAIGVPTRLLLSHWHSWRWCSPLYDSVRRCRQAVPGDWGSAFAQ